MADTFEALGRDESALKQTISDSPPTMDVAIESFRVQRPFLANLEGFGDDFAPATAELRGALPTLNRAVDVAIPVNKRAPRAQRGARQDARPAARARRGAGHAARRPRPRRDRHHAQPAAEVLRPVRDGLQLAELLLHLPGRALLRAGHDRLRAARARQHGRPAGRRRRLDGRRRARQRPERQGGHGAVRAEPAVRRGDHARRARRLRDRPARLAGAQRRRPGRRSTA